MFEKKRKVDITFSVITLILFIISQLLKIYKLLFVGFFVGAAISSLVFHLNMKRTIKESSNIEKGAVLKTIYKSFILNMLIYLFGLSFLGIFFADYVFLTGAITAVVYRMVLLKILKEVVKQKG